jgi:hypothetical protein
MAWIRVALFCLFLWAAMRLDRAAGPDSLANGCLFLACLLGAAGSLAALILVVVFR